MSTVPQVSTDLMAAMNGSKAKKADLNDPANSDDKFLTLLVTQMRNQDPLNPLDNAQVTSQMAQLSTVTGIEKLNTALDALKGSYQSSQALQATGMIGHGVLAPGSSIQLTEGQGVFGLELASPVDDVKVTIRDASGRPVHVMSLGAKEAGTTPLAWDGKTDSGTQAPDGKYSFDVQAVVGGKSTAATALAFGQVGSVSNGSQGIKINVSGMGPMNLADIRQIL